MTGVEEFAYLAYAAAAVSAVSAVSQADAQRKTQHTNADIARDNAMEMSRQATEQIEGQRAKARSIIGRQLADTSESGTGLSGSNLDLLNQSLANSDEDSLALRYNASRNSRGLNMQAGIDDMNADNATTGGTYSAVGSLLNGYARGQSYTAKEKIPGWDMSRTTRGSGD